MSVVSDRCCQHTGGVEGMVDVSTSVYLATQRGVKGGGVQLNKSAPMVSNGGSNRGWG